MEAFEFLKEAKRKCSSTTCDVCHTERLGIMCPLFEWSDGKLEQLVSEVEQWSKEHPLVTNEMKVREVFGDNAVNSILSLHPSDIKRWLAEPYKERES